jgi:hypothetical protein
MTYIQDCLKNVHIISEIFDQQAHTFYNQLKLIECLDGRISLKLQ